ncbi:MAG: TolC family protein [Bacteroidaceae bacterium]|jgi:outer membrane protein|nr:TolC family protein [Bacteroidaceae bacterium]
MTNKTFKIAYMLLGISTCAWAQESWGLQDCIDYALKNNIQIQKNRVSEEKGEVTLWNRKGVLFPSLSFSTNQNVGYRPFTQVMAVVQGDQVTSTSSNVTYQGSYGLNASVTLWNGGINQKNIKEQKLLNEITKLQTEQSELSIQEQIAQLYVQIMYTKEALKVSEELLKTAQLQYDRGIEMQKQGQMAKADVVQLEAQLSSAKYDIANNQARLENFKRQLKAVLELDINSDFDIKGDIPTDEKVLAVIPSKLEAYNQALASRPEIKGAELGIESANMQLDIARRAHYPTVRASASLGSNHSSGSQNNWGTQMKSNLNMSAGVTVSVPIFDNRQIATNIRNAKLNQVNSQLDLQDKKTSLSNTIEQYWINANSNQQSYLAAKARVKSQEASYELLNEQFLNGLKNTVDVLQGRDNVINAEQSMLQSKYTTLLNIQLLKFYTGEKIDL